MPSINESIKHFCSSCSYLFCQSNCNGVITDQQLFHAAYSVMLQYSPHLCLLKTLCTALLLSSDSASAPASAPGSLEPSS